MSPKWSRKFGVVQNSVSLFSYIGVPIKGQDKKVLNSGYPEMHS
jgi:hypothetical protein